MGISNGPRADLLHICPELYYIIQWHSNPAITVDYERSIIMNNTYFILPLIIIIK